MIFTNRLNIINIDSQFKKSYSLDLLGIKNNCVLGISPYKRLTREYDDWLVLVVRVDDLEESYFYPDENGNIDSSEIIIWLAGSNGVVKKVSNQVKTAYPSYQNTLASMPRIVNSGVFDSDGLYYDNNDDSLKMDDYSEIQILNPVYSLYVNAKTVGLSGVLFSKTLDHYNNAQIFLSHWEHRAIWWHNWIELVKENALIEGSENRILGVWKNKEANGYKTKTNLLEYTNTLNTTLTNRENIRMGMVEGVGIYLNGNIKTVLMFDLDAYDDYDDFVRLGL